jgi:hypothetical protein
MRLSSESADPEPGLDMADLARIGVGIVGLLYALGFLVVTFHLSQFGVAPVTWLRPQYLLAGIWCLLPNLLFTAALAFAALQFTEPWIRGSMVVPRKTRIGRHIFGAIQGLGGLFAAFTFISIAVMKVLGLPTDNGRHRWGLSEVITLKLAAFSFATAVCAVIAISAFSNLGFRVSAGAIPVAPTISSPESPKEPRLASMRFDRSVALGSLGTLGAFASLAFILFYVHSFSVSVYSAIPSTLGGGRPQRVVFLIDNTVQRTAPLVVDGSGSRSVPYNLLLITDSSYVVESPAKGELAIEFKQDSVRGMIVLR